MAHCTKHPETEAKHTCRLCKNHYCDDCISHGQVCRSCWYKVITIVVIVMVVITYSSWMLML